MSNIAEQMRSIFLPMFAEGEKDLPGAITSLVRLLRDCPWLAMETHQDKVAFQAADGSSSEIVDAKAFSKVRLPLSALAIAFIRRSGKDSGDYIYAQDQVAHFTFDDGLDLYLHVVLKNDPAQQGFRLDRVEETPVGDTRDASVQA